MAITLYDFLVTPADDYLVTPIEYYIEIASDILGDRLDSLIRQPQAYFTAERFIPYWSESVAGGAVTYAGGHAAAVKEDYGVGEDLIFRVRVTTGGALEVAALSGTTLETPASWDGEFGASGVTGCVRPNWTGNTEPNQGAMVACYYNATADQFEVYAFHTDGTLQCHRFGDDGVLDSSETIASGLDVDSSMQVAACRESECYLMRLELVEDSQDTWQPDVYGSTLYRYYKDGTWQLDDADFLFHTHARADLVNDDARGQSSSDIEAQWGYRPCGGLAAYQIDSTTDLIVTGMRHYYQKAYYTHNQSLTGFLYHRANQIWERSFVNDDADYDDSNRLWLTVHAAGSRVDDRLIVSYVRLVEPSEFEQTDGAESLPRQKETVIARVSDDGRYLTQFQTSLDADDYCGLQVVAATHDGEKYLYGLGYTSVSWSEPADWLCDVPTAQKVDLATVSNNFQVTRSNRWSMSVSCKAVKGDSLTDGTIYPGMLVRAYLGEKLDVAGVEYVQIGQGFIDMASPVFSLRQRQHSANLVARGEMNLLLTRAEVIDDDFPLQHLWCEPEPTAADQDYLVEVAGENDLTWSFPKELIIKQGFWTMKKPSWPALFFTGSYPTLEDGSRVVCAMESTPFAFTGGGPVDLPPGVPGGPGDIADPRKAYKAGTMFNDVVWSLLEPAVDGCISAVGRFGDNTGQDDFSFDALTGCDVYTNIVRSNGLITHIEWFSDGCSNPPGSTYTAPKWNDTYQESCAFGLVARAVHDDLDEQGNGKKYIFLWEAQSDWESGSHLEDQWGRFGEAFDQANTGGLGEGQNRLYLYISDFDETNDDWKADGDWIHVAVAGGIEAQGLTPGKPAELRMQIYGGRIYCFYRLYGTGNYPKNVGWRFAFAHKSGHFGAGKRGLLMRGHTTIQWDTLINGKNVIDRVDNVGHTWDISDTDGVRDFTFRESITKKAWQGMVETQYRNLIEDSTRALSANTYYLYSEAVENPVIDFTVEIDADDGEAGVFIRSIDGTMDDCVSLGIVVNSTYDETDNTLNCYLVKRRYASGVEDLSGRDYSPIAIHIKPDLPYRLRVSVRNELYAVWLEGCYIGHFRDDTELGNRWGLFASGEAADFTDVELTELHHVPEHSLVDPNQTMQDAISKQVGQRAIKGVFRPTGEVLVSHFDDHDAGADLEDQILQSGLPQNNRFVSAVQVQGAYNRAIYVDDVLSKKGRHYQEVQNPDLMTVEDCYIEARAICKRIAEEATRLDLIIVPDMRIEPEDLHDVVVTEQSWNGSVIVDDVTYTFSLDQRTNELTLATRSQYEI